MTFLGRIRERRRGQELTLSLLGRVAKGGRRGMQRETQTQMNTYTIPILSPLLLIPRLKWRLYALGQFPWSQSERQWEGKGGVPLWLGCILSCSVPVLPPFCLMLLPPPQCLYTVIPYRGDVSCYSTCTAVSQGLLLVRHNWPFAQCFLSLSLPSSRVGGQYLPG